MKRIFLTQGKVAIVDDDDYKRVSKYKWYANKDLKNYYAKRWSPMQNGKRRIIWMHRFIMSAPEEFEVDHINQDTLDNRKDNLRFTTRSQNARNQMLSSANTSGFKGVRFDKNRRKWRAEIYIHSKRLFLGNYETQDAAVVAYRQAAIKHHGVYARY